MTAKTLSRLVSIILFVAAPPVLAAGEARNVILFIGDGMGISTITAARILEGQQRGNSGEENLLSFEAFDNVALVKTYNTNAQVPDSAGTMSAMMTGVKTKMGVFGVDDSVERDNCSSQQGAELLTLLEAAEDAGWPTGVVTTTSITHATPAATFGHTVNRDWEADADMPEEAKAAGCVDLARQFVEMDNGDGIDIALGGGRSVFMPSSQSDPEYSERNGKRNDGRDLLAEWQSGAEGRAYVWNAEQLAGANGRQILGLFEPSHMQFEADRVDDPAGEPSLAEMTERAVTHLLGLSRQSETGFVLVVEGGRIDHAHHFGNAYRALVDTIALSDAVRVAAELAGDDTLILVTADHSHTLTISGYPERGNPILGTVVAPGGAEIKDTEGRPYTTLGYANGPGYKAPLPDLSESDTAHLNYQQVATIPLAIETHAGEDVAAYATGPGSEALRGVIEQNEIFFVLNRAVRGFDAQAGAGSTSP